MILFNHGPFIPLLLYVLKMNFFSSRSNYNLCKTNKRGHDPGHLGG